MGFWSKLYKGYGMVIILLLLSLFYSWRTLHEQFPVGKKAADSVAELAMRRFQPNDSLLIIADTDPVSQEFLLRLEERMNQMNFTNFRKIVGDPPEIREGLAGLPLSPKAILTTREITQWRLIRTLTEKFPEMSGTEIISAPSYLWPDFLKMSNMLAIADRTVVIAIIAIGMTIVIITGGIDLSVGSLIAWSAVLCTAIIQRRGGENASTASMLLAMLATLSICLVLGLINGLFVAKAKVAAFIVTLAVMMAARGHAFIMSKGQSIYELPEAFTELGRGDVWGVPNTVILLVIMYVLAYVLMNKTLLGRWFYAVGGNAEAARLAGVPVSKVLIASYLISAFCAGVGGVIQASQLKSGAPTYGVSFEMYAIAAVVIGGTSLSGGTGKILGTLIGAMVIAVIQNGMNLTGVESYTQQVVLGLVILGSVLVDKFKSAALHGSVRRV